MASSPLKSDSGGLIHIVRRSAVGPWLLGIVFGGIPLAFAFSRLGGRLVSAELLRYMLDLTPLAIIITIIGTVWSHGRRWNDLIRRAIVTSFASCFPLPLLVSSVLMWRFGYDVFSQSGLLVLVCLLLLWTVVVAVLGWLLAQAIIFFLQRGSNLLGRK